ncbi:MAG: hypothetical protein C5B49_08895 [Bdellovibrio sp.]|nr:MAG: hypothetical protein C5B49_08895 [Bdellovibrio sp.]
MKNISLLVALTLFPAAHVFAQSSLDDEINAELDRMYQRTQSRGNGQVPSVQINVQSNPVQMTDQTQKNNQGQKNDQGQKTATAAANDNSNSNTPTSTMVQKQPVTVIESSPLVEAKIDRFRKVRQDEEVKTEQKIAEKLELSRIEDERRRTEVLFGDRLNALGAQEAVRVQNTKIVEQVSIGNSAPVNQQAPAQPVPSQPSLAQPPVMTMPMGSSPVYSYPPDSRAGGNTIVVVPVNLSDRPQLEKSVSQPAVQGGKGELENRVEQKPEIKQVEIKQAELKQVEQKQETPVPASPPTHTNVIVNVQPKNEEVQAVHAEIQPVRVEAQPIREETQTHIVAEEVTKSPPSATPQKEEKPLAEKSWYIGAGVGMGSYSAADNVRGNYAFEFIAGLKMNDRILLESNLNISNYDVQQLDSGPLGYDPLFPRVTAMNQYGIGGTVKYQFLSGTLRPAVGGTVQYTYRTFADKQLALDNNTFSSNAVDLGLVAGVELAVAPNLSFGLDYRYMFNLFSNSTNDNLQTRFSQSVVQTDKPIEKFNYEMFMLTGRFTF